jgi:hypothetical protein
MQKVVTSVCSGVFLFLCGSKRKGTSNVGIIVFLSPGTWRVIIWIYASRRHRVLLALGFGTFSAVVRVAQRIVDGRWVGWTGNQS